MAETETLTGVPAVLCWPDAMDPQRFLADHWQRQPLLLPGALPGIAELLDADELAGLAIEPGIESRLITYSTDAEGHEQWQVEHGPFDAERFAALPDRGWTLLVQDVDKHLPDLAALFDRFSFIPSWRIDDLMISYAAPGGTVGPHVDGYDVFLVQGEGTREWQLAEAIPVGSDPALIPHRPLQQLAQFEPIVSHQLEPGDALYLPPGVPHLGVSDSPCMTWSIGFRAPARGQLAASLLRRRLEATEADALYTDPMMLLEEVDAGLISTEAMQRAREFMRPVLETADLAELALALGVTVTTPKDWLRPVPPETPLADAALRETALRDGLTRHGYALLARCEAPSALFACGLVYATDGVSIELLRRLCSLRQLSADAFNTVDDTGWRLLSQLYRDGILLTIADLDDDPS